jgi:hypothetical protein
VTVLPFAMVLLPIVANTGASFTGATVMLILAGADVCQPQGCLYIKRILAIEISIWLIRVCSAGSTDRTIS